jgi:hypothetical protein
MAKSDAADKSDVTEKSGPLDGSTSGTIGGGGPESGGPTPRPSGKEPGIKPENAASGRRAPSAIDAATEPDELGSGPSDVSRS